jgi:hypothetical protein
MNEVSETGMVTEMVKIRYPLGNLRPSSYRLLIPKRHEPGGNWSITIASWWQPSPRPTDTS